MQEMCLDLNYKAGKRLLVILGFALLLWVTDNVHGISPAWVALGAAIVCLLPIVCFSFGTWYYLRDGKDFVKAIETMRDETDYASLVSLYGIRRNQATFWPLSDQLYEHFLATYPREAGLFDLNRYENR